MRAEHAVERVVRHVRLHEDLGRSELPLRFISKSSFIVGCILDLVGLEAPDSRCKRVVATPAAADEQRCRRGARRRRGGGCVHRVPRSRTGDGRAELAT